MFYFFRRLEDWWQEKGFEALFLASIIFIVVFGIYRKLTGKKGTWSQSFFDPLEVKSSFTSPFTSPSPSPSAASAPRGPFESAGERISRAYLERRFPGFSFSKCRPDCLRNPVTENYNLELDCYNKDLKLALEYNGIQHYKFSPYFHRNKDAFLNQKYRDELKRRMCVENGIRLIEVPYTVKNDQIPSFIENELRRITASR